MSSARRTLSFAQNQLIRSSLLAAWGIRWCRVEAGPLSFSQPWLAGVGWGRATWSAEWNYGPGWDSLLYDAYGVRPDADRIRYYRLLYDLSS